MSREKRIYLAYQSTRKRLTREGNTMVDIVALLRTSALFGLELREVSAIVKAFKETITK